MPESPGSLTEAPEPLPDGARLLHIGPPKTGTTSLQSAFHANRAELLRLGVQYAGRTSQVRSAANAVAFGKPVPGLPAATMQEWPQLVREVNASRARHAVISSETFAHCSAEQAAKVVRAFGADRTHVVITARPVADLLFSSWQQYVQGGQRTAWEPWLRSVLLGEGKPVNPGFWRRSRLDGLAQRFGGGAEVVVVVLAERPRDFVLRSFEALLALPAGVLVPGDEEANTALPYGLAEMLRHFNERWASGPDPSADVRARIVEFGALAQLRTMADLRLGRSAPALPRWAVERANAVAAEINDGLRAVGVRVVGDLEALARRPVREEAETPGDAVPAAEAAALLYAAVLAARREAVRDGDLSWLGSSALPRAAGARVADRTAGRIRAGIARRRAR